MFRNTLVFCSLFAAAFAAVSLMELEPKPEKFKDVEGCYIKKLDTVIPTGDKISVPPSMGCFRYLCGSKHLTIHTCGKAVASPPLKVVYDHTKPYPECCGTIVRDEQA